MSMSRCQTNRPETTNRQPSGAVSTEIEAVATDWASAVSAECDYYYKLYSLPGNINLLPTEMQLASPQLDNERNAIHA